MNELAYTTAVARIRVHETRLLGADKIEQLIAAENYRDALKRLGDLGYDVQSGDASVILKTEQQKAWQLLCEIAPDKSELEFLTVRNSFLNLKAALKSVVSDLDADAYFCAPANVPDETITAAVTGRDFSLLPDYMQDVAEQAYALLTSTGDGQLSDVVIDKKAMETYLGGKKQTKLKKRDLPAASERRARNRAPLPKLSRDAPPIRPRDATAPSPRPGESRASRSKNPAQTLFPSCPILLFSLNRALTTTRSRESQDKRRLSRFPVRSRQGAPLRFQRRTSVFRPPNR